MAGSVSHPALRAVPAPALPVERLLRGKPVAEAAEMLPRLFNLCRVAQGIAARAAFGLPLPHAWQDDLRAEIIREHVVKLCLKWPVLLSVPALPLPRDWMAGREDCRRALFGASSQMPADPDAFAFFLAGQDGIAPVLRAIMRLFEPREACRAALPAVTPLTFFDPEAKENSAAARHADHPVMASIEARWGRGPLWSAAGLAYDLEAVLDDRLPLASLAPGRAVVPAARGLYGLRARILDGKVAALTRVTPTDHLLAPLGALEQSLASLPPNRAEARAPLLVSVLDPCYPVALETDPPEERHNA